MDSSDVKDSASKSKKSFRFKSKYVYLSIISVLILAMIVILALWRPWEFRPAVNARTVSGNGIATVSARPNEFVFYASYLFTGADRVASQNELKAKSDEVVKKLKELGVADSAIRTDSSNAVEPTYDCGAGTYGMGGPGEGDCTIAPRVPKTQFTLGITVTLNDEKLAQKVQDYLATTSSESSITPQYGFTEKKRKELEAQARAIAVKDARAEAELYARDLHFSLGPVKSVEAGTGFNAVYAADGKSLPADISAQTAKSTSLGFQPGENKLRFSVQVTYYIK